MPQLLHLLETCQSGVLLRNATWALSNLCRGKEPRVPLERIAPAIPTLVRLARHVDAEVVSYACWALSFLSEDKDGTLHPLLEAGICALLVGLLGLVVADSPQSYPQYVCTPQEPSAELSHSSTADGRQCVRGHITTDADANRRGDSGPARTFARARPGVGRYLATNPSF